MKGLARTLAGGLSVVVAAMFGLMAGVAGADAGYPPPPKPPIVVKELPRPKAPQVALTGSNIMEWLLIAAVCIAVGTLLVVANRRRRARVEA